MIMNATKLVPFWRKLYLGLLLGAAFPSVSHGIAFVGGVPAGTMGPSEGIVVSGGVGYVFITPRHFLSGHASIPGSFGANTTVASTMLSSPAAGGADRDFYIGELDGDFPGLTPVPILSWSGDPADYTNLNLRAFGNQGSQYGTQNTGASSLITWNDDLGGSGVFSTMVVDILTGLPDDRYLFVDMRPNTAVNGTGFLRFGDSNGALLADLGGGLFAAAGTALGFSDSENPRTGQFDAEVNVYNFAGYYQSAIDSWLATRSGILGSTYAANYVSVGVSIVPEPTRLIFIMMGLVCGVLGRRRQG
jgi:hypothetical protein